MDYSRRDEFDDDIDNIDSRGSLKKGNTQREYFDEDLSRKAVGKLFSENRKPSQQDDDFVRGFEKDHDDSPSLTASKRRQKEDFSLGFYDDEEDEEFTHSVYKNKEQRPQKQGKPTKPARQERPERSERPERQERPETNERPEKREAKKIENPVRGGAYPSPIKTVPTRHPKPAIQRKLPSHEPNRDDDRDDYVSGSRFIIVGVVALSIIIMAFLVFQIVSANSKLSEAKTTIETLEKEKVANNEMSLEYENLKAQNLSLQEENEKLKEQVASATQATEATVVQNTTQANQPNAPQSVAGGTTYTVQAGDTLGKIAIKSYGSSSPANVKKIMDANKITDEKKIKLGQTLNIPK